jgi:hypothetical protein
MMVRSTPMRAGNGRSAQRDNPSAIAQIPDIG